jgi:hypothetical protein
MDLFGLKKSGKFLVAEGHGYPLVCRRCIRLFRFKFSKNFTRYELLETFPILSMYIISNQLRLSKCLSMHQATGLHFSEFPSCCWDHIILCVNCNHNSLMERDLTPDCKGLLVDLRCTKCVSRILINVHKVATKHTRKFSELG